MFAQDFADDTEIRVRAQRQIITFQIDLLIRLLRQFRQIQNLFEIRQFLVPLLVEDSDVAMRLFLQQILQCDFGGMVGGFFHGFIEQAGLCLLTRPPTQFVVKEIAEQPRIVLLAMRA